MKPNDLTRIALFAAVTAVLSQISIPLPFSPVPITFSIVAVMLAGGLLSPSQALLSQIVYLLIGAVGAPVYAGLRGGIPVLFGPTGGYLMAYPLMALGIAIVVKHARHKLSALLISMLGALLICYSLGTPWLAYTAGLSLKAALMAGVVPFVALDVIKAISCAIITHTVSRRLAKLQTVA